MINIYNGDCLKLLKDIPDNSIDLILTDPPYNIDRKCDYRLVGIRPNHIGAVDWDKKLTRDDLEKLTDEIFRQAKRVIKDRGSVVMFLSVDFIGTVKEIAQKHGFYYKTTGVWHKTNPLPANMNLHFLSAVEAWIYFTYGGRTGTFNNEGRAVHNYLESSVTPKSEKKFGHHPTQKPESIISEFITLLSNEGDTVLDPFMGSGTTGKVCKDLNRNFIGIEIDPTYYEICQKRMEIA